MAPSRLRVLHCIYDDPANPWVAGGGAVRARELYARLGDRVDATVLSGRFPGAPREEVVDGVHYRRVGAAAPYPLSRLTYALRASHLLRREPYDAAVFDFSGYTPLWLPRHRPLGLTVHHLTAPTAAGRWGALTASAIGWLERWMLGRARWFSATSEASFRAILEHAPEGSAIHRVGAGVPDALFEVERAEKDYLLYFGRLDWYHKGLDVLLAALGEIVAARPDTRLVVAGRGRDEARLRAAVGELGLGHRVELRGAVSTSERARLLAGARALLMPSRFEGFGLVAAEAMAAGVPVVATATGSLPEVVGEAGVLIPPGDAGALARAALRLLADGALRLELSGRARSEARRFRWSVVAEDHLRFLRAIANGERPLHPERER